MTSGPSFHDISQSDVAADELDLVRIFGTVERPESWRTVHLGPLSFLYADTAIRRIAWHGTELVRAISWPVRDESWATYTATTRKEEIEHNDGGFRVRLELAVGDGRLVNQVEINAFDEGDITVSITMVPVRGPFETNRAGLTVLHPIAGLAGAPIRVTHTDGVVEEMDFPTWIAPSQPIRDISAMTYRIGEGIVDLTLSGEVFEMEDQRNWSDASFKTYCVPLEEPFTYMIETPRTQTVRIALRGAPTIAAAPARRHGLDVEIVRETTPAIGLAVEEGWEGPQNIRKTVAECGASHLLVRITPDTMPGFLASVVGLAGDIGSDIDVELVLDDARPDASLDAAAALLAGVGLAPGRILTLPESYLKSYQPDATWPPGPTPDEVVRATRARFPDAQIGGGMLTNFTEFNRCRPDPAHCDFVSHGSSATVHASDDLSVVETLESQAHIFDSAEKLKGNAAYRLGLVTIGMRSNPYGTSVSHNQTQTRMTMARADPRHRGLFGAAWAVGVLASTAGSAVEALCIAAPTGPFGVVATNQDFVQPGFDDRPGMVFPLYHVVRQARRVAGSPRADANGLPEGFAAFGADTGEAIELMIANLSGGSGTFRLPERSAVTVLSTKTFDNAVLDPDWGVATQRTSGPWIDLDPFAIAFLRLAT